MQVLRQAGNIKNLAAVAELLCTCVPGDFGSNVLSRKAPTYTPNL